VVRGEHCSTRWLKALKVESSWNFEQSIGTIIKGTEMSAAGATVDRALRAQANLKELDNVKSFKVCELILLVLFILIPLV